LFTLRRESVSSFNFADPFYVLRDHIRFVRDRYKNSAGVS
jgi:hypothetical protein